MYIVMLPQGYISDGIGTMGAAAHMSPIITNQSNHWTPPGGGGGGGGGTGGGTPCGAKKIRDFDGPVFNNPAHTPQVHLIFWGSRWTSASTPTRTEIESKVTTLLNSNWKYFDALSQYRGVIKSVYGSSVTNTTFPVPSGDIGAFVPGDVVKDSIARGTVPNPNSTVNTDSLGHAFDRANIYAVMIPPGHDIPGFGGLHTNSSTTTGTLFALLGIVWNAYNQRTTIFLIRITI
jgi:hypothetical protein